MAERLLGVFVYILVFFFSFCQVVIFLPVFLPVFKLFPAVRWHCLLRSSGIRFSDLGSAILPAVFSSSSSYLTRKVAHQHNSYISLSITNTIHTHHYQSMLHKSLSYREAFRQNRLLGGSGRGLLHVTALGPQHAEVRPCT